MKRITYSSISVEIYARYICLALVAMLFCNIAIAQDDNEQLIKNHQIWIDFYPHYFVNEKLEYYGDAGYRTIASKRSWSRIYARPSLRYHLSKTWGIHAGMGTFYIFNKKSADQLELTPWQGFQMNWPTLTRFKFKHLIKIEERLSFDTEKWTSEFEFRLRYKLFGNMNFVRAKKIYIPFYGEIFMPVSGDINETYQNKGRAGVGLGYKPNKEWKIALMFNWQTSRTGQNENLNVSDYIYQIKIRKVWSRILF